MRRKWEVAGYHLVRRWPIIAGALVVATAALAQRVPDSLWGIVYNSVFPTLSDKQSTVWQSTSNGRTNVTGLNVVVCVGGGTINLTLGCTLGRGLIP